MLPNPKELRAILKVCREMGVTDIKVDTLEIKLGEMPADSNASMKDAADNLADSGPSEDDLLYWSSQPDPKAAMMDRLG